MSPVLSNEKVKTNSEVLMFTLRIIPFPFLGLICQLKNNMDRCRRIDGLSVSLRRLEFDLLSGAGCGFIESVAEAANDIQNANFACSGEEDVDKDFALQFQLACFVRIVGFGFGQYFNRYLCGSGLRALFRGFGFCGLRVSKSALF